jgi:DNA-binding Xre family transcriptional regulator
MTVAQRVGAELGGGHFVGVEEGFDIAEQGGHPLAIMCDRSHSQYVIHRGWRNSRLLCETPHMAEVFDMAAVRAAIERKLVARKLKKRTASVRAGLGPTALRDIIDFEASDIKTSTLVKIAEVLDVSVDELVREPVFLVGKIGAGGAILFEEYDEPREVPRPPAASGPLVALEVQGDSMLPRYDEGDIIYIRRDHQGVLPEYLGHHCAIHLADGGTFLKILEEGTEPGRYTLRSHNAADMRNVEVVWAAPVLFVMPKRQPPMGDKPGT